MKQIGQTIAPESNDVADQMLSIERLLLLMLPEYCCNFICCNVFQSFAKKIIEIRLYLFLLLLFHHLLPPTTFSQLSAEHWFQWINFPNSNEFSNVSIFNRDSGVFPSASPPFSLLYQKIIIWSSLVIRFCGKRHCFVSFREISLNFLK